MNEYRDISELHNWDKNPRAIETVDFERGKKQLIRNKEINGKYLFAPLMVMEDGTVLGGNMRLRALRELGETKVWVETVHPKTEAEMLELAMMSNDAWGKTLEQELAEQIDAVKGEIDLSLYKYEVGKMKSLDELLQEFGPEPEEDEFDATLPEEPVSKLGEVYQLGRHRVMCGDSTKIEDVEKLMDGQKADMVFTDPPYGVDFQSNMRVKSDKFDVLKNDNILLTDWISPALTFSTGWVLFCTTWKVLDEWLKIGKDIGDLSNMIIWDKGGGGIGDLNHSLSTDYEIILAYNRGNEITGKRIGSVWDVSKDLASLYEHPTQKPVGLSALAIKTFCRGDVLDLFLGSGSTLIACEQTNRTRYGMELDPRYCDVIRKRYANFIGQGDKWEEITAPVTKITAK